VADTGDGLWGFDIDQRPAPVAFRDRAFRWAISLAEVHGRLLVGYQDKRVELFDVKGSSIALLSSVVVDHRPARLSRFDHQVWVADHPNRGKGATLLEVVDSRSLVVRGSGSVPGGAVRPVGGTLAFAAEGDHGLALLSLEPFAVVQAREPAVVFDRVIASKGAVLAWHEGEVGGRVFGAPALPEAPTKDVVPCGMDICTLTPSGQLCLAPRGGSARVCQKIEEGGNSIAWQPEAGIVWLLDAMGGLGGFKKKEQGGFERVAIATRPATNTNEQLDRLVIEGARAVAIDPLLGLLQVFDLGEEPRRRGFFVLNAKPRALALAKGVALVATQTGMQLVDIKDADKPVEIGWIGMAPGQLGVAVASKRVALAEGERGVSLWDWDGRGGLSALSRSDTPGVAADLAFAEGNLWVADTTGIVRCRLTEARR
jgi:hypothetical protein